MSGWQIAGIIAAGAFAALALALAYLLMLKLGGLLDEVRSSVRRATDDVIPTLREVTASVQHVNAELERVDVITANVQDVTHNVSALTAVFAATLGGPAVKVAAFTYGVRRALGRHRSSQLTDRLAARAKDDRRAARSRRPGRRGI